MLPYTLSLFSHGIECMHCNNINNMQKQEFVIETMLQQNCAGTRKMFSLHENNALICVSQFKVLNLSDCLPNC